MERIKWRNHADLISPEIMGQVSDPDFYDIVLIAEKQRIHAHKLILCAASPYLKNRMKELKNSANPDEIPLPGIRFEVLQKIIQYVYYGETFVEKDHFEAFLMACQQLEIKGPDQNPEMPPLKKQKQNPTNDQRTKANLSEGQSFTSDSDEVENLERGAIPDETFNQDNTEEEEEAGEIVPLANGKAVCLRCNKTLSRLNNAKAHFNNVHRPPVNVKCTLCGLIFKNNTARAYHTKKVHGVTLSMIKKAVKVPLMKVEADE